MVLAAIGWWLARAAVSSGRGEPSPVARRLSMPHRRWRLRARSTSQRSSRWAPLGRSSATPPVLDRSPLVEAGGPAAREAARQRQDEAGAHDHGHERAVAHRRRPLRTGHAVVRQRDDGVVGHPVPPLPALVRAGGVLWSAYTCLLAYKVSTTLAEFPPASVVISGVVTTVILAAISLVVRRRRRAVAA